MFDGDMTITIEDYLMGRDKDYPGEWTFELVDHATDLLQKVNTLLSMFYAERPAAASRKVNSGWRPAAINAGTPGAAKKSKHMTGNAVDLSDSDEELDEWCESSLDKLKQCGLYMESPTKTPKWCHLQNLPPISGRTLFFP